MARFALELSHWTKQLTLVTHGHPIDEAEQARLARHGVPVRTERVQRLEGQEGLVSRVVLVDGAMVRCDVVFFNIAHLPRNELARALGCELGKKRATSKCTSTIKPRCGMSTRQATSPPEKNRLRMPWRKGS